MSKLAPGIPNTMNVGETRIAGRINVGASGAVSSVNGDGFTVVKTATAGKYTVTLLRSFKKLVGFNGSILYASSASLDKLRVNAADNLTDASGKTFTIITTPGDSTTTTNPASGDSILFEAIFLGSKVSV